MSSNIYTDQLSRQIWKKMREVFSGKEKMICSSMDNGNDGYLLRIFGCSGLFDSHSTRTYWQGGSLLPIVNNHRQFVLGKIFNRDPTFTYYTDLQNGERNVLSQQDIPDIYQFQNCCTTSEMDMVEFLSSMTAEILLVGETLILVLPRGSEVELRQFKVELINEVRYNPDGSIKYLSVRTVYKDEQSCDLILDITGASQVSTQSGEVILQEDSTGTQSLARARYVNDERETIETIIFDVDFIPAIIANMCGCKTNGEFSIPFLLNTANLAISSFLYSCDIAKRSRSQASPVAILSVNSPDQHLGPIKHGGGKVLHIGESFEYNELSPATLTALSQAQRDLHDQIFTFTGQDLSGTSARMAAESLRIIERANNNRIVSIIDGMASTASKIISIAIALIDSVGQNLPRREKINVDVNVNRRLDNSQISAPEVEVILKLFDRGLMDYETFVKQLRDLGVYNDDTDYESLRNMYDRASPINLP